MISSGVTKNFASGWVGYHKFVISSQFGRLVRQTSSENHSSVFRVWSSMTSLQKQVITLLLWQPTNTALFLPVSFSDEFLYRRSGVSEKKEEREAVPWEIPAWFIPVFLSFYPRLAWKHDIEGDCSYVDYESQPGWGWAPLWSQMINLVIVMDLISNSLRCVSESETVFVR